MKSSKPLDVAHIATSEHPASKFVAKPHAIYTRIIDQQRLPSDSITGLKLVSDLQIGMYFDFFSVEIFLICFYPQKKTPPANS